MRAFTLKRASYRRQFSRVQLGIIGSLAGSTRGRRGRATTAGCLGEGTYSAPDVACAGHQSTLAQWFYAER